jgi:hypothetical protein
LGLSTTINTNHVGAYEPAKLANHNQIINKLVIVGLYPQTTNSIYLDPPMVSQSMNQIEPAETYRLGAPSTINPNHKNVFTTIND